MASRKRLVRSSDTSFNSEIKYDEKDQRWVATKTLTQENSFETEESAKDWIKEDILNKAPSATISPSNNMPKTLPPPPGLNLEAPNSSAPLPPPPVKKQSGLPVGAENQRVQLPIATTKKRRLVYS